MRILSSSSSATIKKVKSDEIIFITFSPTSSLRAFGWFLFSFQRYKRTPAEEFFLSVFCCLIVLATPRHFSVSLALRRGWLMSHFRCRRRLLGPADPSGMTGGSSGPPQSAPPPPRLSLYPTHKEQLAAATQEKKVWKITAP